MPSILILGISASPRDEATKYAVQRALTSATTVEGITTKLIDLSTTNIKFCLHCDKCGQPDYFKKTGHRCAQNDGMEGIYEDLLRARGLIIGSPSYGGSLSGQAKAFLDRLRPIWRHFHRNYIVGQAIATGGSLHGGQDIVVAQIHSIMNWWGMWIVPTGTWNSPHGAKLWSSTPQIQNENEEGSGLEGVQHDIEGLEACALLGKRIAIAATIMSQAQEFKLKLPPLYE